MKAGAFPGFLVGIVPRSGTAASLGMTVGENYVN